MHSFSSDFHKPGPTKQLQPGDLWWTCSQGPLPLIAVAVHPGSAVRRSLLPYFALDRPSRLREEDPHTDTWTAVTPNRLIGHRSRFEADLNRPRDSAIYRQPDDAWGLDVWTAPPSDDEITTSLAYYDGFYEAARHLMESVENQFGKFVVYDLHTYNHRRSGPNAPPADTVGNPEVNIGTGTLGDRAEWAHVIDAFIGTLRSQDFAGRHLDVRENVKFRGGQFSRWVHENFPGTGLAIAIEFKKFFMDEWTGKPDSGEVVAMRAFVTHIATMAEGMLAR